MVRASGERILDDEPSDGTAIARHVIDCLAGRAARVATSPGGFGSRHLLEGSRCTVDHVSVVDVIEDLNALRDLANDEVDDAKREALDLLRQRLADRDRGAKVSEAAALLGVSAPTVRAWIRAGVLEEVSVGATPQRLNVLSLADVKRIVDLLRANGQNRDLLSAVYRLLRDPDLLESAEFERGMEDLRAGRLVPIGDDLREEMAALDRTP
jgi:excisionase family DNA binding protein